MLTYWQNHVYIKFSEIIKNLPKYWKLNFFLKIKYLKKLLKKDFFNKFVNKLI